MPSECLNEHRVKDREVVTLSVVESTGVSIGSIMDIEHFSSYEKLIGSTAYVISFESKLKQLIGNQEDSRCGDREENLRKAEVFGFVMLRIIALGRSGRISLYCTCTRTTL